MQPNPEVKKFELKVQDPGRRLDKHLALYLATISRSRLQNLIIKGNVLVNGENTRQDYILKEGDTITVLIPSEEKQDLHAEEICLDIIYEDDDIAVVNKPAGMTVHPGPGCSQNTLVNALLARYPKIGDVGSATRPGIVHRLDRDTSGVMVITKSNPAWEHIALQFRMHKVTKKYLALVRGRLEPSRGIIDAPIGRHPSMRKKYAIVEGGKSAKTVYEVKQYYKGFTLVQVLPETGRTHQIRVHMQAIGFPIMGDAVYGVRWPRLKRQFLHAYKLGFKLPGNNEHREFCAELPEDLRQVLDNLNSG